MSYRLATDGTEIVVEEPSRKLPFMRGLWDKTPSFARRPVIWCFRSEWFRLRVLDKLGIRDESDFFPLSNGGCQAIDIALDRLIEMGIQGDYLEFGLYRGFTFWHAQQAAKTRSLDWMRFYGFDSFEGLPEVEGPDKRAAIFISGDYRCTKPDVQEQLSKHGFDWTRAELIEGYFDESLKSAATLALQIKKAALVMIDCDLYQSTVPVLSFLRNLLQDGTIVLFDDWYCFGESVDQGEPRAFREFLEEHPEWDAAPFIRFPTYGKGFLMRRRDSLAGL